MIPLTIVCGARYHVKEAILCGWGITRGGSKILLHLASGNKESYENWLEFLRDMIRRGAAGSDGSDYRRGSGVNQGS